MSNVSPVQKQNGLPQSPGTDEAKAASQPVPLWRNRDFLLLLGGQAVSSAGSQASLLAFPLLILAVTRSPVQAGLITGLRGLPFALFCLPAGALIDRWDRKCVMILCDIGRALALGSIPLVFALGHLTLAAGGKVQSFSRGRARRWMTPPVPGLTTMLLLPAPFPSD